MATMGPLSGRSAGRSLEGGVAEREDPAVGAGEQVAGPVGGGGAREDRRVQRLGQRRVEVDAAETDHPAIVVDVRLLRRPRRCGPRRGGAGDQEAGNQQPRTHDGHCGRDERYTARTAAARATAPDGSPRAFASSHYFDCARRSCAGGAAAVTKVLRICVSTRVSGSRCGPGADAGPTALRPEAGLAPVGRSRQRHGRMGA